MSGSIPGSVGAAAADRVGLGSVEGKANGSALLGAAEALVAERDGCGESLGAGMNVRVALGRAVRDRAGLGDGEADVGDGEAEGLGLTDGSGMIGEGDGELDGLGVGAAWTGALAETARTSAPTRASDPTRRADMAGSVRRRAGRSPVIPSAR